MVLFQPVGASEFAVRNESELPISVVKVALTVIAERVKSQSCRAFRTGAKIGTDSGLTGIYHYWNSRHIEDGMQTKMSGEQRRPYLILYIPYR